MSASNWVIVWAGCEINILRFVPIILLSKTYQEPEGAIKYLLVQVLGSAIILISRLIIWFQHPSLTLLILSIAIIIKLGGAPCHFWFPHVISCIS